MRQAYVVTGIVAGVALLGGAALIALADNAVRSQADDERIQLREAIKRYDARFVADQKLVSSSPLSSIVLPSSRTFQPKRDARPFLDDIFPWPGQTAQRALPQYAIDSINAMKHFDMFIAMHGAHAFDASAIDTSWLHELRAQSFDAWDLDRAPAMVAARPVDVRDRPLPDFSVAAPWAAVHMMKAVDGAGVVEAGRDLEELARLLVSTETSRGAFFAAQVLRIELAGYDYAINDAHLAVDAGFHPPERDAIDAFSRVSRASSAYFSLHADPHILDDLVAHELEAGRCPALAELAVELIAVEPVAPDLDTDVHAAVSRILQVSPCRLPLVREAWEHPGQRALAAGLDALCDPENGDCVFLSIASHVPGAGPGFVDAYVAQSATDVIEAVYGRAR